MLQQSLLWILGGYMENTNKKTKTEPHAETPAAEEKKPQTDSHSRALAFILTAVVSMGIGAGALYLSKRKQIESIESGRV